MSFSPRIGSVWNTQNIDLQSDPNYATIFMSAPFTVNFMNSHIENHFDFEDYKDICTFKLLYKFVHPPSYFPLEKVIPKNGGTPD